MAPATTYGPELADATSLDFAEPSPSYVVRVDTNAGASLHPVRQHRRARHHLRRTGRLTVTKLTGSLVMPTLTMLALLVRNSLTTMADRGNQMTSTAKLPRPASCSFCAKADTDVHKVIAGPGVFICDECVQVCNTILETDDGSSRSQIAVPRAMTDEQILDQLPRVAAASAQIEAGLQERVDLLRERKVTWARIGAALGMTRQSAWERFSGEE